MKKIWIVDDDTTYVFICKHLFEKVSQKNTQISVLNDGAVAIAQIEKLRDTPNQLPDLILLDLDMPCMDGWSFIDHFRVQKKSIEKDVQIIILSSSLNYKERKRAANCKEVSDYIVKPITASHIKAIL